AEVLIQNPSEIAAVALPEAGGRILFHSGDPLAIELVDGAFDAITLPPAVRQCGDGCNGRLGTPFSEPGVFAKESFQRRHAFTTSLLLRRRGAGGVELTVAV